MKISAQKRLMQSCKANVDAGELVYKELHLGKFGKGGRGYESRAGRTAA